MATKHINYLSRDFDSIKSELINYSKSNYPQLSDNFGNDSSISSWLVDLMSDCVDSLNYHIDRVFQNTQMNSTNSRAALLNMARSNGLKVPGPKAGMCEVEFSCILPAGYNENGKIDISQPNWNAAPVIQRNCVVAAGNLSYTIDENIDFAEQFNSNAFSNRSYKPRRNANGEITGYTVTKTAIATAGSRKVYKKVLTDNDIAPFMEIILPDKDVINVESVIFKGTSNINVSPEISEYYENEEEYQYRNNAVTTYRFFETQALTDQWRWGPFLKPDANGNLENELVHDKYDPDDYVDYNEGNRVTRIYRGGWRPLRQKFISEYTDNGYMKLIFGSGVDYQEYPSDATSYAQYRMSAVINNDMLGVLPKAGWTMFVLYNVGGGIETNVAKGAVNTIKSMQTDFPNRSGDKSVTGALKGQILRTISVTNVSNGVVGKNAPSVNELKYMIKYNTASQERCVTLKDYKTRLMQMPPKYGAPFRCSVIEENNKIVLSVLGMNADGSLYKAIPSTLAENIENYLSHYKSIGDYVEIKSGKIYNIGFVIDAFIDKSYNSADVIANIISTVRKYMDVNNVDMGEDIFIGDLNKEISIIDGLISLIDVKIYKINGGGYSTDKCPLPSTTDTAVNDCMPSDEQLFTVAGAEVERIDLDAIDSVLYGDSDAMYEVKQDTDICIRVKQK